MGNTDYRWHSWTIRDNIRGNTGEKSNTDGQEVMWDEGTIRFSKGNKGRLRDKLRDTQGQYMATKGNTDEQE